MLFRSKSPGPNGVNAGFYQEHWELVRPQMVSFVKKVFEERIMPDHVNSTLISLIPKVEFPEMVSQFRPISLCNVSYKVVTKIIVERIRPMIPELVKQNQCSFIPSRQTVDNIIIA